MTWISVLFSVRNSCDTHFTIAPFKSVVAFVNADNTDFKINDSDLLLYMLVVVMLNDLICTGNDDIIISG